MSYRVLVLPKIDRMRPELLRKIRELVAGGVVLVGPKPTLSPSLQGGYPNADLEVQALANEIWGDLDGAQRNRHFLGKGMVAWGLPLEQVVGLVTPQMENPITGALPPEFSNVSLKLPRDAEFAGPLDSDIEWIHRRTADADYYFVANRTDRAADIQSRFRVAGKEAEIWHPDTGVMEPASYSSDGARTTVPLHLNQRESVFVVFGKPTTAPTRTLPAVNTTPLATIDGSWNVAFQPGLGAPESVEMPKLDSWTNNANAGVKYFSGTATYTKTLQAAQNWFTPGAQIVLDLGNVGDLAQVSINGKSVGTLWKPPYQIDVTSALKPGDNKLEISVTNEWTNRITGDAAAPAGQKVLSGGGGGRGFGGAATAKPSGLMGPVLVVSKTSK